MTGSNAVNVFLGLGLPWSIAAIYWGYGLYSDEHEEAWLKTYGGEYAVTADGTIVGRGNTQYPASPKPATPAPTYMKRKRKEGPGRRQGYWFGETAPIGLLCRRARWAMVAVFTICALTTIAVLYYRRVTIGAELGGPRRAKRHAALGASGSSTSSRRSCRRHDQAPSVAVVTRGRFSGGVDGALTNPGFRRERRGGETLAASPFVRSVLVVTAPCVNV